MLIGKKKIKLRLTVSCVENPNKSPIKKASFPKQPPAPVLGGSEPGRVSGVSLPTDGTPARRPVKRVPSHAQVASSGKEGWASPTGTRETDRHSGSAHLESTITIIVSDFDTWTVIKLAEQNIHKNVKI